MACREVLLTLHRKDLLDYPPPLKKNYNTKRRVPKKINVNEKPIKCHIKELDVVTVKMVISI
jgi:hypothetical protein